MIDEQNRVGRELRQKHIDALVSQLSEVGYQIVLAIDIGDVEARLEEREEQQTLDYEALQYVALQAAFQLGENHLDILPVDEAIDEAIESYIAEQNK